MSYYNVNYNPNVNSTLAGTTLVAQPNAGLLPNNQALRTAAAANNALTNDELINGTWTAIVPSHTAKLVKERLRQQMAVAERQRASQAAAKQQAALAAQQAALLAAQQKANQAAQQKEEAQAAQFKTAHAAKPTSGTATTGLGLQSDVKESAAAGGNASSNALTAAAQWTVRTFKTQLNQATLSISLDLIRTKPKMLNIAEQITAIHFSQDNVGEYMNNQQTHYLDFVETILTGKFEEGVNRCNALAVVIMPSAVITSFDNRRLYCANLAAKSPKFKSTVAKIYVVWHTYTDKFDKGPYHTGFLKIGVQNALRKKQEDSAESEQMWLARPSNIPANSYGDAIFLRMRSGWETAFALIEEYPHGFPFSEVALRRAYRG